MLVIDVSQARDLPDHGSITAQLIGVDDLWDVIFTQQPCQEGLCRLSVSVSLEHDVEH